MAVLSGMGRTVQREVCSCRVVVVVAGVLGEEAEGGTADEGPRASEMAFEACAAGEEACEGGRLVLGELHVELVIVDGSDSALKRSSQHPPPPSGPLSARCRSLIGIKSLPGSCFPQPIAAMRTAARGSVFAYCDCVHCQSRAIPQLVTVRGTNRLDKPEFINLGLSRPILSL